MIKPQKLVQSDIVLTTINARYIHAAFGLRYLKANLGELESDCSIIEFTLESRTEDMVESLLAYQPKIIGIGVYIWNIEHARKLVSLIRTVSPQTIIVLGGPEVSYELEEEPIVECADYVITGWGDISFSHLAHELLQTNTRSEVQIKLDEKIISGLQPKLDQIKMPYHLYTEDDIKNRVLYVEASRGCPFKCEFCLSALDKTAWPYDLDSFLQHMSDLYDKGARHFKFVDRTFNLKIKSSIKIMEFFLQRMNDDVFLHFEVIPDHLPEQLKEVIEKFPSGSLQFEIGIQTFNVDVQSLISRKQNNDKAAENIRWIIDNSNAHVHADLIFGLPSETIDSFAQSFDRLVKLAPHEIQVGILKRLKGSPIIRHTERHALRFNPNAPYSIVSSDTINYQQVQSVNRFARYWDLIGNSGRFKNSLEMILGDSPFDNFMLISNEIYKRSGQTHKISLLRLYDIVFDILIDINNLDKKQTSKLIALDHQASGLKSFPKCLINNVNSNNQKSKIDREIKRHNARQSRH